MLRNIEKCFSGTKVLDAVSLTLRAGEILSLVGENGSGKSTTMNVATGIVRADAGTMILKGAPFAPASRRESERAGIGFIQQELNVFPNLSVAENLFLGRTPRLLRGLPIINWKRRAAQTRRWLEMVGLTVEPKANTGVLSAGQRQLLEIARALSGKARILIFDEPTTSLTEREREHLFSLIRDLRSQGIAIVFISHALEEVLRLSDRVIVLRDGRVTLDRACKGLTQGHLVSAMIGREIDTLFPKRPPPNNTSEILLKVAGLSAAGLLADIQLEVRAGEIVGVGGLMGAGRTEFARILFGLDPFTCGQIRFRGTELPSRQLSLRHNTGMAFLTEDRRNEGLLRQASVEANVYLASLDRFSRRGSINFGTLRNAVDRIVMQLGIKSGPLNHTPIEALSGGNQQKALLARWMLTEPRLLLLDEPTRGVDIGAKQDIYRLIAGLAGNGGGILVISSEIEELMGLCDRIMVLHRGRISGQFERPDFDREALLAAAFGNRSAI